MIKNCPVTVEDVLAMEEIYGPSIPALKGKTVRRKGPKVKTDEYFTPPPVVDKYRSNVIVEANVIYVSTLTFWFTLSRKLDFLTIERVRDRKTGTILKAMTNVLAL